MKKIWKYLVITLLFGLVLFAFLFFLQKEKAHFTKKEEPKTVDYFTNQTKYITIFEFDSLNRIIYGKIHESKESLEENIESILSSYTVDITETSYSFLTKPEISYIIKENQIEFDFSNLDFQNEKDILPFLESLYLNFRPLFEKEVILKKDHTIVKQLGQYNIETGINYKYVTRLNICAYGLNQLQMVRIFSFHNDLLTYENYLIDYHNDNINWIMMEIKRSYKETPFSYEYDKLKNTITIHFSEKYTIEIQERIKLSIQKTLFYSYSDLILE